MANMADATNIQSACMRVYAKGKGGDGIRESDTILSVTRSGAGESGNWRGPAMSKSGYLPLAEE